jgi:hypothetical protein
MGNDYTFNLVEMAGLSASQVLGLNCPSFSTPSDMEMHQEANSLHIRCNDFEGMETSRVVMP